MLCQAYGHAESTKSQEHVSRKESASLDLRPVSFHHPKELCRIVQQFQVGCRVTPPYTVQAKLACTASLATLYCIVLRSSKSRLVAASKHLLLCSHVEASDTSWRPQRLSANFVLCHGPTVAFPLYNGTAAETTDEGGIWGLRGHRFRFAQAHEARQAGAGPFICTAPYWPAPERRQWRRRGCSLPRPC